ncbi:hypothetical protein HY251_15915 [bacterium]|nr:hypothetical protein [bacterium]
MSRESDKVRRAFEMTLVNGSIDCWVDRQARGGRKQFRCNYDRGRGLFRVPEQTQIVPGDLFILPDGSAFRVGMVQAVLIDATVCYWEVTPTEPLDASVVSGFPGGGL